MKITLCEMGGIGGRGGARNELRNHFPPAARTASCHAQRPGRSTILGACLLLLVAQQLSLIHHTSVDANTLNVFLFADWWNLYGFAACGVN